MVKAILTENYVQWFSNDSKEPFLEYNIDTDELNIIDQNTYQREMDYTLYHDIPPLPRSFKSWFPKNSSTLLSLTIGDIVSGKFYENKKNRKEIIDLFTKFNLK